MLATFSSRRTITALVVLAAMSFGSVLQAARAETVTARISGVTPGSAVVNPVTNKVYVRGQGRVTVIDGATNAVTAIDVVDGPAAFPSPIGEIAVNPLTNRIYVVNRYADTVTVIDGATHATTVIGVSARPNGIAINTVTNEIYVSSAATSNVTVIAGATNATTIVPVAATSDAVAVNPVTNRAYVATHGDSTVTVIDGVTKATSTIPVPSDNRLIAVNPVTNRIYLGRGTVIDGASNTVLTTVVAVPNPFAIAVNPATNKIYITEHGFVPGAGCCSGAPGGVYVIDGATNAATYVTSSLMANPRQLSINPVTNRVYVLTDGLSTHVYPIDGETNAIDAAIAVGWTMHGIAINPVTNKIFVSRGNDNNELDVIDGATNQVASITVSGIPWVVEVNAITDKAYVMNASGAIFEVDGSTGVPVEISPAILPYSGSIVLNEATNKLYRRASARVGGFFSVIDLETRTTTNIPVSKVPVLMAVNPRTNRVFVVSTPETRLMEPAYADIDVIDGETNAILATIRNGLEPVSMVVNPVTDRAYVANRASGITVVDGINLSVANIPTIAREIAVNARTNRLYASTATGRLQVIDGNTNIIIADLPMDARGAVAVNPATERIYAADPGGGTVTVIDGQTHAATVVTVGNTPRSISIDPVANKIYVANEGSNSVSVIDGVTNAVTTLTSVATSPGDLAVNPVTSKVYVASGSGNSIGVVTPARSSLTQHGLDIAMAGDHVTAVSTPGFVVGACCAYAPADPAVNAVYYRPGAEQGAFMAATGGPTFIAPLFQPLLPGMNFVKFFALDAMAGSITSGESTTMIGAPQIYPVMVVPLSFETRAPLARGFVGTPYSANILTSGGLGPRTLTVSSGSLPPGLSMSSSGAISGTPTTDGFFPFTVQANDTHGGVATRVFAIVVVSSTPTTIGNISTRGRVGTGNDVVIGGFVIGGSANKTIAIVAVGPSLAAFGIANPLANPTMQLVRASDQAVIATNDDWGSAANAAQLEASGFAPSHALESGILVNLPPGAYTAIVSGVSGGTGVGMVAVYEIDHPEVPLANISTRGQVLTGNDVMIGGFVVTGTTPRTVAIVATGPSLAAFGVANPLGNPHLQLVRASDQAVIAVNDDWIEAPNRVEIQSRGYAPTNRFESAILMTLEPGSYTAILSGVGGSTGVGIVAVYAVP